MPPKASGGPSGAARSVKLGAGAEFDLIRRILAGGPWPEDCLVPPGDDCVVLSDGTALSSDVTVEDVHFRRSWLSFEEVGFRAVTAALSDLAAVGAQPVGALLSIAAAADEADRVADEVAGGAIRALRAHGAWLLGGDLSRSPGPLFLDVAVVGRAPDPLRRGGVRADDEIWVTGRLGASAGAVRAWSGKREPPEALRASYAEPTARIAEARWLRERFEIHGLIDLSDGLAGDAGHLAAASGVGITLVAEDVPVHPALLSVASGPEALELALSGGEDYELCFAAAPGVVEPVAEDFRDAFGVELHRVGSAREGRGVELLTAGERTLLSGSFDHFQGPDALDPDLQEPDVQRSGQAPQ